MMQRNQNADSELLTLSIIFVIAFGCFLIHYIDSEAKRLKVQRRADALKQERDGNSLLLKVEKQKRLIKRANNEKLPQKQIAVSKVSDCDIVVSETKKSPVLTHREKKNKKAEKQKKILALFEKRNKEKEEKKQAEAKTETSKIESLHPRQLKQSTSRDNALATANPKKWTLEDSLETNVKFLLEFAYSSNQLHPSVQLIKNLAYLFNLHRYLLGQMSNLKKQGDINFIFAYRTLLVHTANKVALDMTTVLATQKAFKAYIDEKNTPNFNNKNPLVDIANIHDFQVLIQSLPIYQKCTEQWHENTTLEKVDTQGLEVWFREQALPIVNFLQDQTNKEDHPYHISKAEYLTALNMIIIILGEYCHAENQNELKEKTAFHEFMKQCRIIRNTLAHLLQDVPQSEWHSFFDQCRKISDTYNARPTQDLLSPPKVMEEEVNNNNNVAPLSQAPVVLYPASVVLVPVYHSMPHALLFPGNVSAPIQQENKTTERYLDPDAKPFMPKKQ